MSTTTTRTSKLTNTSGFPPEPPEAHQRAGVLGQTRTTFMSGSRIEHKHNGRTWVVTKVTAWHGSK